MRRAVCVWAAVTLGLGGCHPPTPVTIAPPAKPAPNTPPEIASGGRPQVRIDEAAPAIAIRAEAPKAAGTDAPLATSQLAEAETAALLARLEPLPAVASGAPAMRAPSAAPPRPTAGSVQPIEFVAPNGTVIPDAPPSARGPNHAVIPLLAIPGITPSGERNFAQAESDLEITVRFYEPMIPVAAVGTVATPAITIAPPIAGTWRWIDTSLVKFTPATGRIPMATSFTITVAAGATAVSGARLAAPAVGTFDMPPVMLKNTYLSDRLRGDAPIVLQFDQDVAPTAIAKFLHVVDAKHHPVAWKPSTPSEATAMWAANPTLKDLGKVRAPRVMAIAPVAAWPTGELRVVLAKGAPSLEGSRRSTEPSDVTFDIAPTFRTLGLHCDDRETPRLASIACGVNGSVQIDFTNDVERKHFDPKWVANTTDKDPTVSGSTISIATGDTIGESHTIELAGDLVDELGQHLTGARTLAYTTTRTHYDPYLGGAHVGLYVLDPRFTVPQWTVGATAIAAFDVALYQVEPKDYFAFEDFEAGKRATPPGKRVFAKPYTVGARFEATARVDLRPALDASGTGHVIAVATARGLKRQVSAWIQVSKLAISTRVDAAKAYTWVHELTPGTRFLAPVAGATTTIITENGSAPTIATSDASGAATVALPAATLPTAKSQHQRWRGKLLLASHGADSVFAAVGDRYVESVRREQARWYVTDDRFTYRPGEPVYVKGWVREVTPGVDPVLAMPAHGAITYELADGRGAKLGSGTATLSDQGGFDVTATLPANANLGPARFTFTRGTDTYTHTIQLAEFRTPAFAVALTEAGETTPLVAGETVTLTAGAHYFTGGVPGDAKLDWAAELQTTTYRPPNWDGFSFAYPDDGYRDAHDSASLSTTLDSSGSGTAAFAINHALSGHPAVLTIDASVIDVDRHVIRAASRPIVVHASAYYVGVHRVSSRDPAPDDLELIVTDPDGLAVAGVPIDVTITGTLPDREGTIATSTDTQHCKLTSAATPVRCHYVPNATFTYAADARVVDRRGRANLAHYTVPWWRSDRDAQSSLSVTADRPLYQPGDVAHLTIHSTLVPARATVTFARGGVIAQRDIALAAATTIVDLPIVESYVENLHVLVDRYTRVQTDQGPRDLPAIDSTSIELAIDREAMRLATTVRPTRAAVDPGDLATFDVQVERDKRPVAGAEVALIVVDEAVLSMAAKSHADPLVPFYRDVDDGTSRDSTFGMVANQEHELAGVPGFDRQDLDDPHRGTIGIGHYGSMGGGRGHSAAMPSVSLGSPSMTVRSRKDFKATAVFAPRLVTDANGRATFTVTMPDNLTRYRVVALASSGVGYFGKGESTIVARREVSARSVPPRFLTQGDTFALPVVVQNLSSTSRTVDVAVRAANLVAVGPAGKRIVVPAGGRGELRFGFKTTARGTATIQTIAVAGTKVDASDVTLPVYEPATTEAFATYGVVDEAPAVEQLVVPKDVLIDVGGVEAEVSSTQLQSITDAYWYLHSYRYECAEQRSARMLATTALADVLDAFQTPGRPSKVELAATRATDLEHLSKDQNGDGSWGYWRELHGDPYVTFQVLAAIAAVDDKKSRTVRDAVAFTNAFVDQHLAAMAAAKKAPMAPTTSSATVGLVAAALVALAAAGVDVAPRAQRLHELAPGNKYPTDAKARLLALVAKRPAQAAMRARLLADLLSSVHETAASATVASDAGEAERALLPSNTKTSALVLDALIREAPGNPVIAKLARGVLDARQHGRWHSTQENLVALQAMRRYFDAYEAKTPNYTGKLWLGTAGYAEQSFVGRSTVRGHVGLAYNQLTPGSTHDIAFAKVGTGRMYYRLGITYAPAKADLPPLDAGFIVRRTYSAVDDPRDVVHLTNGTWKIKLGAKVLVQLEAINTTRRDEVALADQLPAGFEIVDVSLATSEREAVGANDYWDHTNFRNDRAEAFALELAAGSHHLAYTVRATTPGTFIAAPAKAEEMYAPETFGRTAGTTVVIE